jgi:hypothetical protein
MPFDIEGHGWELRVRRLGLHQREGERSRTYGTYQVFIDGKLEPSLFGYICECIGPGDNTAHGKKKHLRIRENCYALSTQFGDNYSSVDFSRGAAHPCLDSDFWEQKFVPTSLCIQVTRQICICPALDA